jgi:predicted glutamine amidotransferase
MARELRTYGPASFLYSDGDLLFAHADRRIQPLTREVSAPALYLLECSSVDSELNQSVTLVASLPLSNAAWEPMPEGQVISLRNGKIVSTMQL